MSDSDAEGEQNVWVAKACSRKVTSKVFHTDPDCYFITDSHMKRTWEGLPDDFSECNRCSGAYSTGRQDQRQSLRDLLATGEIEANEGDA